MAHHTPIVNRVSASGILTLNLEDYRPAGERVFLDIKDQLYMGMVLREKDFREWIKAQDWKAYSGKYVALGCSADAIVPAWAYMLLATVLWPHAKHVAFGTLAEMEDGLLKAELAKADFSGFKGEKVVLKGCGGISAAVYAEAAWRLMPYVAKLMYGEPCSMVPLFKDLNRANAGEKP